MCAEVGGAFEGGVGTRRAGTRAEDVVGVVWGGEAVEGGVVVFDGLVGGCWVEWGLGKGHLNYGRVAFCYDTIFWGIGVISSRGWAITGR